MAAGGRGRGEALGGVAAISQAEGLLQECGSGGAPRGARGWRRAGVGAAVGAAGRARQGSVTWIKGPSSALGVWEPPPPPPQAPPLLPSSALHAYDSFQKVSPPVSPCSWAFRSHGGIGLHASVGSTRLWVCPLAAWTPARPAAGHLAHWVPPRPAESGAPHTG